MLTKSAVSLPKAEMLTVWILYLYFSNFKRIKDILFPTKVNLENVGVLYSACSNPTKDVLVIALGIIIGKDA